MKFKLEQEGKKELERNFQLASQGAEDSLEKGTIASAILVEGAAKNYIRQAGIDSHQRKAFQLTGDTYLSSRSLRRVTGNLANSITHKVLADSQGNIIGTVGTNSVYGKIHETGGVIRAKHKPFLVFKVSDGTLRRMKKVTIPARPYILPALLKSEKKILELYSNSFWKSLSKRGIN